MKLFDVLWHIPTETVRPQEHRFNLPISSNPIETPKALGPYRDPVVPNLRFGTIGPDNGTVS